MNIFFTSVISIIFASHALVYAKQDSWKGEEYAKHSESQKTSAEDFMQGVHFKGTEKILDVGCGDGKITAAMARAVPQGSVIVNRLEVEAVKMN